MTIKVSVVEIKILSVYSNISIFNIIYNVATGGVGGVYFWIPIKLRPQPPVKE